MKKWFRITFVILTGLIVAGITFTVNKSYMDKHTRLQSVVVAEEKVSPYNQLNKYKLVKMVTSAIPEDAITSLDLLDKKEWYTGELGIGEGDVIRTSRLFEAKDSSFGPAIALKNNHVLVGVKTDQVLSAGRNLKSGVLVHAVVFISGDRQTPDQIIGPNDDPLLANLLVKEVQNAEATALKDSGREALPVVAVIEAQVNVAKKLVEYQERGKVYLMPTGIQPSSPSPAAKSQLQVTSQPKVLKSTKQTSPSQASTNSSTPPANLTPAPTARVRTR